ncbi:TetR/AcrR family transcriptional regulator [Compostimonas suwonensis]|uniref:AcrR family transcriptional regulator n=1 Tax=Compostimonas suwonensis TaxID=1048394 RepID=A0A2M9BCN3_9MICO|nr:TetR/AcrR family transcriptional regulator [Compostimonas suwonensis]PJJ55701.1 AcrR family transcriptional regulator [Compostimonas suwonensis]
MAHYSPAETSVPDLRERRRRELARAIALAAVELFEQNGFQATTIDDIAAATGISRTTFFRHCATKEAAVLVDDAGLEAELLSAAGSANPQRPLGDLEGAWEPMTVLFDEDHEGHNRFLRVRRLMRQYPALLAAGLERDARLTAHLAERLTEHAGLAPLDAHAVAESFSLGMRLSFDEWVRAVDAEPEHPASLTDIYTRVRTALREAIQEPTP